jgi:hypothetical protein
VSQREVLQLEEQAELLERVGQPVVRQPEVQVVRREQVALQAQPVQLLPVRVLIR